MGLGKKYNIEEEKITLLVKDGVIGWEALRQYEIVSCYQNKIEAGIPRAEAVKQTSEEKNITCSQVYRVLKK